MREYIWRFGNCQITIGRLFFRRAWGVSFAWGLHDAPEEWERLYEHEITVGIRESDVVGGYVQWYPAAWLTDDCYVDTVDSSRWTGRQFVLTRIACPFIYWS